MSTTPQFIKRTCSTCLTCCLFKQTEVKKGVASSLTKIARRRERRGNRGNLGKWSEPPAGRIMKGRKPHLVITCQICERSVNRGHMPRSTKFLIVKNSINTN
jgi:ribosomal protein L44E